MASAPNRPEPAPRPPRFRLPLVACGLVVALGVAAAVGVRQGLLRPAPVLADDTRPGEPEPKKAAEAKGNEDPNRIAAPELDGGAGWLNTAGPLKLRDLRGKIVLLDFWTYCCINCMHVLPDLAKLEKKYANDLVVIGVHSGKFDNEKDNEHIRKAVLRYEISHPVVNDADMKIWATYGVHSWPTQCLIDPEGYYVGSAAGEGNYELLDRVIGKLVEIHRKKKTLDEKPRRFELARYHEKGDSPLFFPGKVLADAESGRLFIADSTHHRIVITTLEGKKIAVAGAGTPGKDDGSFDKATFNDPQGLALRGETLYVADRKNNLIRALDLKAQAVTTVAGTGALGDNRFQGGPARKTALNSPWALYPRGATLFIAMAGFHQIWTLDLDKAIVSPYAGNGREAIEDGSLDACSFAQPSGLTSDGRLLYVADSEGSAVRAVPMDGKGEVRTIIGNPGAIDSLFTFGDADGQGAAVRLQHALGIAYHNGKLYVADTYNSKIKVIDPEKRTGTTLLGGEAGGWLAGPLLVEPAGVSVAGDKLYIADTNAHRVRVVDLKARTVQTLTLQGVQAPKPAAP